MKSDLAKHLWASTVVRSALKKEAIRLLMFVVIYSGTIALIRYSKEESIQAGILSASIGIAVVILAWLLSAIRTIRIVLRENGLLER
jgi:uncharacterized membrane protein